MSRLKEQPAQVPLRPQQNYLGVKGLDSLLGGLTGPVTGRRGESSCAAFRRLRGTRPGRLDLFKVAGLSWRRTIHQIRNEPSAAFTLNTRMPPFAAPPPVPHLAQGRQVVLQLQTKVLSRGLQVVSVLGGEPGRRSWLGAAVQVAPPGLGLLQDRTT